MTFLPIAHRELRIAARSRATRRWRILFAIGAVVIAGGVGYIAWKGRGVFGAQAGIWIFNVLKYLAFAGACLAGVFLTSDCLSEEKREGTLGLLFLTDLRGYDVAIGKLLATSLRTFYGLLAVFPVMAMSFVLGGIPADEFWHSIVSICNALFFSLAMGMAVSVISRDANRAMTATLGLLAVTVLLIPPMAQSSILGLISPSFSLLHTTATFRANDFWWSVALVHGMGWAMLAFASWMAPRTWQEKGARKTFGGAASGRRELLEQNPIAWIVARDRWAANISRVTVAVIVLLLAVSVFSYSKAPATAGPMPIVVKSISGTNSNGAQNSSYYSATISVSGSQSYRLGSWISSLLTFALELWIAAHVSRFYVEGRRNGFFELLWVTPVRSKDIIDGQWIGLRRLFFAPIAAQLVLTLVLAVINIGPMSKATAGTPFNVALLTTITAILGSISWTVGLFAIAWFSIWMGVKSKNLNFAVLKTFLFVKVIPWMAVGFLSMIVFIGAATTGFVSMGAGTPYLIVIIPQVLIIAAGSGLIAFGRIQSRDALTNLPELALGR